MNPVTSLSVKKRFHVDQVWSDQHDDASVQDAK